MVVKETTVAMSIEELNGVDLGERSLHELYKNCFGSIDVRFEGNYGPESVFEHESLGLVCSRDWYSIMQKVKT